MVSPSSGLNKDDGQIIQGTDWDTLALGVSQAGVFSGWAVTPTSPTPDMNVTISGGRALIAGSFITENANFTRTIATADATNRRYDLIFLAADGSPAVSQGTAAGIPNVPDVPGSAIPLALIMVGSNVGSIVISGPNSAIRDVRSFLDERSIAGAYSVQDFAKGINSDVVTPLSSNVISLTPAGVSPNWVNTSWNLSNVSINKLAASESNGPDMTEKFGVPRTNLLYVTVPPSGGFMTDTVAVTNRGIKRGVLYADVMVGSYIGSLVPAPIGSVSVWYQKNYSGLAQTVWIHKPFMGGGSPHWGVWIVGSGGALAPGSQQLGSMAIAPLTTAWGQDMLYTIALDHPGSSAVLFINGMPFNRITLNSDVRDRAGLFVAVGISGGDGACQAIDNSIVSPASTLTHQVSVTGSTTNGFQTLIPGSFFTFPTTGTRVAFQFNFARNGREACLFNGYRFYWSDV